ncbi:MAG: tyrosine--tRNA ligase [Acidobacteria bacterium]|jgi:tyrosyl-tRNA synthetase|nr:tyrosine--tRNA ligase [Acidobacteriota bacterium]
MSAERREFPPADEQLRVLRRGVVDLISEDELRQKLERSRDDGRPLSVKVGFDPTAPDIHLGHTVLMRKMRQFQDLGHQVVYVIGDFTAAIGDPSGRSKTRPPLTREQILANAETYTRQAFMTLDRERAVTRFNSEWLSPLGAEGMIKLAAKYTVARMLERRDFRERFDGGVPISVHELLYPLAQAYDSVALAADVELGGTDQLFNLNVGREIMPDYGLAPQVIMTVPLLEGTDGSDKMSKSLGNYVGVTDAPNEIFGKVMSISDTLMWRWYELLTDEGAEGARALREVAERGERHPRDLKVDLARLLVARFHGDAAADEAVTHFEQVFARKELPDEIATVTLPAADEPVWLPALLKETGLAASTSAARRLIQGGGVKLDGEKVVSEEASIPARGELLIQVGKRHFLRVRFG